MPTVTVIHSSDQPQWFKGKFIRSFLLLWWSFIISRSLPVKLQQNVTWTVETCVGLWGIWGMCHRQSCKSVSPGLRFTSSESFMLVLWLGNSKANSESATSGALFEKDKQHEQTQCISLCSLLSFQQTRRAEGLFRASVEKGFSCENESSPGGAFFPLFVPDLFKD